MNQNQRSRFNLTGRRAGDAPVELKSRQDVTVFIREANAFYASIKKKNKKSPVPVIPCFINADAATELLSRNHNNRSILKAAASDYTLAMEQGKWIDFGGSAIQVGPDGNLLNGQNRLLAAHTYMSGKSNVSRLGFNFEVGVTVEQVQSATDHGRARTPKDYLALLGLRADAKALRLAFFAPGSKELVLDGQSIRKLHELFKDEHDFVFAETSKYTDSKMRINTRTAVLGALIRAAYHLPHAEIARFIELLCSKPGEVAAADEHEQSVLRFREYVIAGTGGGSKQRRDLYGATTNAIARFHERRPMVRQRTTKLDIFPLKPEAAAFLLVHAKSAEEARTKIVRAKALNLSPNYSVE